MRGRASVRVGDAWFTPELPIRASLKVLSRVVITMHIIRTFHLCPSRRRAKGTPSPQGLTVSGIKG